LTANSATQLWIVLHGQILGILNKMILDYQILHLYSVPYILMSDIKFKMLILY